MCIQMAAVDEDPHDRKSSALSGKSAGIKEKFGRENVFTAAAREN